MIALMTGLSRESIAFSRVDDGVFARLVLHELHVQKINLQLPLPEIPDDFVQCRIQCIK